MKGKDGSELIEVFVTSNPVELNIVKDLLISGEIEVVAQDRRVGPFPVTVGGIGEQRLYVHERDHDEAKKLLEEFNSP